mmetsp:Transcript_39130/g.91552  ORF Transcript_39130/g.91552 Transcript_39130/m.91552 type:complete len:143 (-) Transcript_39130:524-952(-)
MSSDSMLSPGQSESFPAAERASKANRESSSARPNSVNKRLQSELMSLMMGGDAGISAFPDGDNIFQWTGTITGGAGTVYEGLTFKLALKFPTSYPFEPPQVTFTPSCPPPYLAEHVYKAYSLFCGSKGRDELKPFLYTHRYR